MTQIRLQLEALVREALEQARLDGSLALEAAPDPALERPGVEAIGVWASTVAMRCAKLAHKNPREIAQIILDHLPENTLVASAEIAGPGFINFRIAPAAFHEVLAQVRELQDGFGKGVIEEGKCKVNLEYVSANPTGPMHVGHGRWAALGDAMARVMRHAGYEVWEEFYINDHGVQLDVFGESISVRYMQLLGHDIEMPENCYGGGYVADIAQNIIDADGRVWESCTSEERKCAFRERGYAQMVELMRNTLEGFGTTFDCWFSERSLYVSNDEGVSPVSRSLAAMDEKGYIFQDQGATWFRSTAFDDSKDRVLIKANGEYTYFMSDVAYHYDKMMRGFDHLINIWGADHHGYVKRCEAMLEAWGWPGVLEIVLGQLVNLFRDGEAVRMSKRTGEMITFAELIDEVGVDATRFLMLQKSSDQPIDFDIEVAKKRDNSNPVYYVQYAHARICSLLRKAAGFENFEAFKASELNLEEMVSRILGKGANLSLLQEDAELALMRKMDEFTDLVALAARDRAPFRLTHYAQELASLFHGFYSSCRILDQPEEVKLARLALADATRILLALTLKLLGVSAPEAM